MEIKLFELRDRATFIPIVCINCDRSSVPEEHYILRRAGYSCDGNPIILLTSIDGGRIAHYDFYNWGDRTFRIAHEYITDNWNKLTTGDVVDVEFILGETDSVKPSERLESFSYY